MRSRAPRTPVCVILTFNCAFVLGAYTCLGSDAASNPTLANLDRFPLYKQPDEISCGPCAVSMILGYFGTDAGIGPLKTACNTRLLEMGAFRLGATRPEGIIRGFERYGVRAEVKTDATLADVRAAIDRNRPPLLLIRSGCETWHYVVAVGYRAVGPNVVQVTIADPGSGRLEDIEAERLLAAWNFDDTYTGPKLRRPSPDLFRKCVESSGVAGSTLITPTPP
jgi:hypothetical protein